MLFHGTTYSPRSEPWPGWLFYASTNFGPTSVFYRDFPEFTAYIARCQSILQAGEPDGDILLYFPIHDVWHSPAGMLAASLLPRDPTGETLQLIDSLAGPVAPRREAGVWAAHDGQRALLMVALHAPLIDSDAQQRALATLDQKFAALNLPDLRLLGGRLVLSILPDHLDLGMPGGGFILSSSNSIHSGVKPENYLAMIDEAQR